PARSCRRHSLRKHRERLLRTHDHCPLIISRRRFTLEPVEEAAPQPLARTMAKIARRGSHPWIIRCGGKADQIGGAEPAPLPHIERAEHAMAVERLGR